MRLLQGLRVGLQEGGDGPGSERGSLESKKKNAGEKAVGGGDCHLQKN